MSTEWYYSQGGQQIGPVTSQQLKDLAAGGQLTPNDLVWKDGMPEWTPAARVRGLFPGGGGGVATATAPQPAYAQPQAYAQPAPANADYAYAQQAPGGQIGYYSASSDIGVRTRQILAKLPTVTGPRGEWPLSDNQLSQFAVAEAHRKPGRAFNTMCRLLMIICILASVLMGYVILQAMNSPFMRGDLTEPVLIWLAITGLAVLYPLSGGAAMKCRLWGPITVLVLLSIGTIFTIYGLIQAMNLSFVRGPELIAPLVALVINVLCIVISVRAIVSIPRFLTSPVWCVEAMINAKQ